MPEFGSEGESFEAIQAFNRRFSDFANAHRQHTSAPEEQILDDQRLRFADIYLRAGGPFSMDEAAELLAQLGHEYMLDPEQVNDALKGHRQTFPITQEPSDG